MFTVPDVGPVSCLLPSLAASPFNIAPERREELKALVDRSGLQIVFDGQNRETTLKVVYGHNENEIWFGVAFAERLWAYCFCYVHLLAKVEQMRPGEEIDFESDPDLRMARELLIWAHMGQIQGKESSWPDNLPRPAPEPTEDFGLFAASEAFLSIGGWTLLHEIGHVACGHGRRQPTTSDEYERMEYQADDWASHWIFDRWQDYDEHQDPRIFIKRSLGTTFALAIIASFEVYHRTYGNFKHPDPPDRLLHFLDAFVPEGNGLLDDKSSSAWSAACIIINLHLQNTNKKVELQEYTSFRQFLKAVRWTPLSRPLNDCTLLD